MINDYDPRDTGENAYNNRSSPPNTPRAIAYGINRLGSRHASNDTFHLDLHHSSSQPNLDPASSTPSPTRRNHANSSGGRNQNIKYKLDYYSIPVFLLESIILGGLGYAAYYIHCVWDNKSNPGGFYCDDNNYKYPAPHSEWEMIRKFETVSSDRAFILLTMLSPLAIVSNHLSTIARATRRDPLTPSTNHTTYPSYPIYDPYILYIR